MMGWILCLAGQMCWRAQLREREVVVVVAVEAVDEVVGYRSAEAGACGFVTLRSVAELLDVALVVVVALIVVVTEVPAGLVGGHFAELLAARLFVAEQVGIEPVEEVAVEYAAEDRRLISKLVRCAECPSPSSHLKLLHPVVLYRRSPRQTSSHRIRLHIPCLSRSFHLLSAPAYSMSLHHRVTRPRWVHSRDAYEGCRRSTWRVQP